jgi:glycine/D-amino acid oxidase-like deaminating enzyme/nitrite reductase/ring-hydroxylating ferredoxin subunit
LLYHIIEHKFGEEAAGVYAQTQEHGLQKIIELAHTHQIDCDLERKAACTYTCEASHLEKLEAEAETTRRLGLSASLVKSTNLPFKVLAALRFENQAQFHPIKYVAGLAQTIPGDGSHVFEESRVTNWEPRLVETDDGSISASHIVMATHLPLGQIGGYYAKAYPYAEPLVAAPIDRMLEDMYINVEQPSRSIRTHRRDDGRCYAIAVGAAFKPGHHHEERSSFAELESWLRNRFGTGPVEHRWVNEDYSSIDRVPFIGWSSSSEDKYLIATGFGAWGITNGTAAGYILADLAVGKDNGWGKTFDPQRLSPVAGGPRLAAEAAGVAAHLVKTYLPIKSGSLEGLSPGDAAILKVGGEKVAAFRDENGKVHVCSAYCSHMGCLLGWNETDRTWDCHCHGSRFAPTGAVIHGPAIKPLSTPDIE